MGPKIGLAITFTIFESGKLQKSVGVTGVAKTVKAPIAFQFPEIEFVLVKVNGVAPEFGVIFQFAFPFAV